MRSGFSRREFLRTIPATLAAASTLTAQESKPRRVRKGEMVYRRLGRTDLMVSEISLGGSPAPNEMIFGRAIARGVNYADTSETYEKGNSERKIGKMIKGRRDKFYVATKCHPRRLKPPTPAGIIGMAEASLKRLDSDYIDIYMVHGASKPEHLTHEAVLGAFDKLKKDGKIRFTGASLHGPLANMAKLLVECGRYDVMNIPYNMYSRVKVKKGEKYDDYLQRSDIEGVLALAKAKDIGVVAMKSMAGGNFQKLDKYLTGGTTVPQAKLKWILENDAVGTIVSELLNADILKENLAVVGTGLTRRERQALYRYAEATSSVHCRMCGTCQEVCPNGIATTDIQRYLAYHDGYGKRTLARRSYAALSRSAKALRCQNCGACEQACPYGVSIRQRLRRAERILA
ncbi:MAG: 4Fe-4S dicluster domain-containing protein [Planctomycetes bacterium]|nr:4Fe-4S dicluster domain-containing protein [Planctomycetota bacterium]